MIPTPFSHKRKQFKIEFYKNQKLVCKCHFHITTSQNNKCAIIIQKSSLGLHPNKHDTYSHNFGLQVAHFWLVTILYAWHGPAITLGFPRPPCRSRSDSTKVDRRAHARWPLRPLRSHGCFSGSRLVAPVGPMLSRPENTGSASRHHLSASVII